MPRLIRHRSARTALICGACGITAAAAVLTATRTTDATVAITMAALGFAAGLTIVPQQHRLFALAPRRVIPRGGCGDEARAPKIRV